MDARQELLRHALATVAYRGGKALRGAPASFAGFQAGGSCRTPVEILAHIGDLFDWALSMAKGAQKWSGSPPLGWDQETARFFETLRAFDEYLGSGEPLAAAPEKILQGPVADALTHIGQIAMLRGLAGAAIRPENYFVADIAAGRVGAEQAPPRREF